MRWIVIAFALLFSTAASAQCNGNFPPQTACGTVAGGAPGPVAFSTIASDNLDVYLIAGQSNARGNGTAAQSPTVPTGQVLEYCLSGSISDANDPVCNAANSGENANTGSAWPSLGLSLYNANSRRLLFVQTAIGNTSQTAAAAGANGNWDVSGTLFPQAITALNTAIAAAKVSGYNPIVRGVLWDQGENDANAINASVITQGQYITALTAMIARFRSTAMGGVTYPSLPFYLFRTGTDPSQSDTGYASIRSAQDTVIASDLLSQVVFRDAIDFPALGYQQAIPNSVHYTQSGYNMMGRIGASNVVSAQSRIDWQPSGTGLDLYYTPGNVVVGYPVSSGAPFAVNSTGVVFPAQQSPGSTQLASNVEIISYGTPAITRFRTALGTAISPTQMTNGTVIGGFLFLGYDGTPAWAISGGATIRALATENWVDATHHGGMLVLRTTPNATSTNIDRVYVNQDGTIRFLAYGAGGLATDSSGNITAGTFGVTGAIKGDGISTLSRAGCSDLSDSGPLCNLAPGTGLFSATGSLNSRAETIDTFAPGLITAVVNTKAGFTKWVSTSIVDNLVGSATSFTCTGNPIITYYECGTDATCASPTAMASVTVTAGGQAFPASTISAQTISATHYTAWAISSGTCASLDIFGKVQAHAQ